MHSHHPPKLMDNCYVNKPDCKYPSNLSSARSKSMKKSTSFTGQTEETNSKPDSSSNESQISAWLLQCNNASVTFGDENDRQPENKTPTEGQQINYNPQKHFNDHSRSYSTYEQKQDAGKVASVNKKELRSIFNSKNSSLNEVSENNLKSFTKQLIHSNHERLDEQNKLNDVKNNHSQSLYVKKNAKKLSDKVSDNDEFNVQMNPNNVKYYDANSTNATDWASVSSSEWGDDMCEFDRQQSFRVHEMFEEIDRILFDNLTFDSRDQTQKNNVNTSPDDKTYYSMNKSNCLNFPSYTDDCHPINIDNLRLLSSNPEETQNLRKQCVVFQYVIIF
ncbi:unnamed protein product [Heterobilharzia americana]|nr:unnamed protein product [Heterobilharzia americana]